MPDDNSIAADVMQAAAAPALAGPESDLPWQNDTADTLYMVDCQLALFGARVAARPGSLTPDHILQLAAPLAIPAPLAVGFLFRRFPGAGWCSPHDLPAMQDRLIEYPWIIIGYPMGYIVHGVFGGVIGEYIVAVPRANIGPESAILRGLTPALQGV